MPELFIVVTVLGLIVAMATPKIGRSIQSARLERASRTVAGDLQLATSLAARLRKPVRLVRNSTAGKVEYTIFDRTSGAPLQKRLLGKESEFQLSAFTFSRDTIEFFPNGVASQALTVTLKLGTGSRQVTMTRVGFVRVQ